MEKEEYRVIYMARNTLLITNSDFGVQNTIGARALPIAEEIIKEKNRVCILCRDSRRGLAEKYLIKRVVPFGSLLMKALTAVRIYLSGKIRTHVIKDRIFDHALSWKIRRLNISDVDIVHSWDFLPNTYRVIKKMNRKTRIIQDVAIAFPNVIKKLEKDHDFWQEKSTQLANHVRESLRYVDQFIVPSEFVKQSLVDEGIDPNNISLVPFGVDIEKFRSGKGTAKKFRACFVGNISHRKGIKYLVDAWKDLKLEDAELNLYGRVYPEVAQILRDSRNCNINTFGFIDPSKELPRNDIYVFPSLVEGSSKSVYEALACGLPVITTFNSGSIVRDGLEGFIVPVQDVESLKEKILFFYRNRGEVEKFGKRSRKRAERFTWKRYGKEVLKAYGIKR